MSLNSLCRFRPGVRSDGPGRWRIGVKCPYVPCTYEEALGTAEKWYLRPKDFERPLIIIEVDERNTVIDIKDFEPSDALRAKRMEILLNEEVSE